MLRSTFSIILTFIVFISVVSQTSQTCLAGVQGDVELLKTIALKHKTNFKSILTWKGEAFEQRTSTKKEDNYSYMIKNKCTFAYDQLQHAVRWNMDPQECYFLINGEPQCSLYANYNSIMIKKQSSYDYKEAGLDQDDKATYQLVIGRPGLLKGHENKGLDPRYFYFNHDLPIHDKLMHLYKNANNPELMKTYVKREGDYVTITTVGVHNDKPITEKWVFDLSISGNLIEYYNEGPHAVNTRKYEYEDKSGVWILKSYKRTNVTHHKDGELGSTRMITWSNSIVNVPFEEDEFTLEKLGVKRGTMVYDHRINKGYRYNGVLAEVPPEPETLMGKQLPQTDGFGIPLTPDSTKDKIVLFCFWDMKQRPARQCVRELANRTDDLKKKGVVSILIHASPADPNAMNEWMTKFKIPSPCGVITGDAAKVETIRCKWGVRGLPWLILTDKRHLVQAEGFGINDLDEKITALMEE